MQKTEPLTRKDIAIFRANLGLTQQQMADKLGLSREHINRLESGSKPISSQINATLNILMESYNEQND